VHVPDILRLTGWRKHPDAVCTGCGLELTAGLAVRDIDSNGDLGDYHQACAPSLLQGIDAQRLRRQRRARSLS
jgi:hypothetical protein